MSALAVLPWLAFLLLITLAEISTMGGVWWRPEPCRCLISHFLFCFGLLMIRGAIPSSTLLHSSRWSSSLIFYGGYYLVWLSLQVPCSERQYCESNVGTGAYICAPRGRCFRGTALGRLILCTKTLNYTAALVVLCRRASEPTRPVPALCWRPLLAVGWDLPFLLIGVLRLVFGQPLRTYNYACVFTALVGSPVEWLLGRRCA